MAYNDANKEKCASVTFSIQRENCLQLFLDNIELPRSDSHKYLGTRLDKHLFRKAKHSVLPETQTVKLKI